jgi:hypothetical protein
MSTGTYRAWASGAALSVLVGCGGATFTGRGDDAGTRSDTGSHPDAGGHDGSHVDSGTPPDGGHAGECPGALPSAGASCSDDQLACEYGNDPSISCDTVVTCTSGAWVVTQPGPSTPCSDVNPAACPATYADVPQGLSCLTQADCYYPEARCSCDVQCFDLCAVEVDGGPNEKTWACDVPPASSSCPVPRPRMGSACSAAGQTCDYGACDGNVALECTDGVWQRALVGCPV